MVAASGPERPRLALFGFYHWHLFILLGIVALASALERAIGHPSGSLEEARAIALGGGVALFLVGDAMFRRTLRIGAARWRLTAAALALATIPLGTGISALVQLAALLSVLVACLLWEQLDGRRTA